MDRKTSNAASVTIFTLLAGLLSHNLVIPVMAATNVEDQKNYYTPDPHAGSPSSGSYGPPSHSSGGGHGSTTPSHGGGGSYNPTPSNPPSGGSYNPTPSNPPGDGGYNPTPSTPPGSGSYDPTPSPPSSDGTYNPTPSTPSGSDCGSPPNQSSSTPSNPSSGGGGYYNSPPTYGGGSSPPTYGGGSSPPTYGGGSSPPTYDSPPTTPVDPGTPYIPTPPYLPSPSPFTGTCNYWSTHPTIIWGLLGWWGTLGHIFGMSGMSGYGSSLSLPEALSNTRTDGLGALFREGTASYLNSLVNNRFPYTTQHVRNRFVASLDSNKAASAQAHLFKMANEGHLKTQV